MYVFDPLMCDCEVCQSRRKNLPPEPELKPCDCGNVNLAIIVEGFSAIYFIECSNCGLSTNGYKNLRGVHGVTRAAKAWNRGETFYF